VLQPSGTIEHIRVQWRPVNQQPKGIEDRLTSGIPNVLWRYLSTLVVGSVRWEVRSHERVVLGCHRHDERHAASGYIRLC
jgi:hypothetical protein